LLYGRQMMDFMAVITPTLGYFIELENSKS